MKWLPTSALKKLSYCRCSTHHLTIQLTVPLPLPTPGAATAGRQTAEQPPPAALPASLHKGLHQAAGPENQGQTETTQGQPGGPESSTQTPRQTQVHTQHFPPPCFHMLKGRSADLVSGFSLNPVAVSRRNPINATRGHPI